MAAKNLNKVNGLNLFGYAGKFSKGVAPNRLLVPCIRCKSHSTMYPKPMDFTKVFDKNSPVKVVRAMNLLKSNPNSMKRFETELAKSQLRKSNEVLKQHYIEKRKKNESLMRGGNQDHKLPALSQRLKDIMKHKSTVDITYMTKKIDLKAMHGYKTNNCFIDYKPQSYIKVNRWHIKLPPKREQRSLSTSSLLGRRSRKGVKPPGNGDVRQVWETSDRKSAINFKKQRTEPKQMWQIGSLQIPRL